MIIDVHGHAGPWFFSTNVGSVALNLALMDRYGVDRQIVSASEAVTYDMVSGNRWLAEVLETHQRLLGSSWRSDEAPAARMPAPAAVRQDLVDEVRDLGGLRHQRFTNRARVSAGLCCGCSSTSRPTGSRCAPR